MGAALQGEGRTVRARECQAPHEAGVSEFPGRQPFRVGIAARRDGARDDGNDVGRRRPHVDEQRFPAAAWASAEPSSDRAVRNASSSLETPSQSGEAIWIAATMRPPSARAALRWAPPTSQPITTLMSPFPFC